MLLVLHMNIIYILVLCSSDALRGYSVSSTSGDFSLFKIINMFVYKFGKNHVSWFVCY